MVRKTRLRYLYVNNIYCVCSSEVVVRIRLTEINAINTGKYVVTLLRRISAAKVDTSSRNCGQCKGFSVSLGGH